MVLLNTFLRKNILIVLNENDYEDMINKLGYTTENKQSDIQNSVDNRDLGEMKIDRVNNMSETEVKNEQSKIRKLDIGE